MDSRVQADLRRLVKTRAEQEALTAAGKPAPKLEATSLGQTIAASASGQGIASPLTEPDYATRTHHAAVSFSSSDGLFVINLNRVNTVDMVDAAGREIQFIYDAP